MYSKSFMVIMLTGCLMLGMKSLAAAESATEAEILSKTNAAANYLADVKEAGLEEFKDPKGRWAWKDTYIFVLDCEAGITVGHIVPQVVGRSVAELMDMEGNPFGLMICAAGEQPKGEWIEYWWTKPDSGIQTFRKISYCRSVPGTPYVLGAGIYEPVVTLDELNERLK